MRWKLNNTGSYRDKNIVITGANSGLGFETSLFFAKHEANVIMACRNMEKGENAKNNILQIVPDANIWLMSLDLANLSSVKEFSHNYKSKFGHLDILYNNAGLMFAPYSLTADGFEMHFGVNHLGHFALTGQLLDIILKTDNSRIVTVSSVFHYFGKINFDDIMFRKKYSRWSAYGRSKLANLLFTFELQRKLEENNKKTIAVAAHPGWATTHLVPKSYEIEKKRFLKVLLSALNNIFGYPQSKGVIPQLRAGTDPEAHGGDYYGPGLFNYLFPNKPVKVWSTPRARNKETAAKLWELSEHLTGVKYKFE